jgi:hypothetical protein
MVATSIAQIASAATPADRAALFMPPLSPVVRGVHLNFFPSAPLWAGAVFAASSVLPRSLQWVLWGADAAGDREYSRSGLPLPALVARILETTGYMHQQVGRKGGVSVAPAQLGCHYSTPVSLDNQVEVSYSFPSHLHHQATRPDTTAVALHDSPLGTLALLLEKVRRRGGYITLGGHTKQTKYDEQ